MTDLTKNIETYLYPNRIWIAQSIDDYYRTNYDSLMLVVEKIISEKFEDGENVYLRTFGMINNETGNIMVRFNRYQCFEAKTLLEATYLAVMDYVTSALAKNEC